MTTPKPERPSHLLPFAPAHHCWSCGKAIEPLQAVGQGGVCDRFECRVEWARRRRREEARIQRLRNGIARDSLRALGVDPDEASWSLTPSNPAVPVSLTRERRQRFLRHLRRIAGEAVRDGTKGSTGRSDGDSVEDDGQNFGPPGLDERVALEGGCAACRGWCCRRGGTHAFLEPDRIRRLLVERPELTPEDVVDLYASHLGEQHLEGGCVFQGESGCRLPREIRGDTCNRYHCPDLGEARRQWRKAEGPGKHHFVALTHMEDSRPRTRTVDIPDL